MGYTTDFEGEFKLDKPLDAETKEFLEKLSDTRRMKRTFPNDEYGVDGEFYVDDEAKDSVVEINSPPSTQPSLWCQWIPNDDGSKIILRKLENDYDPTNREEAMKMLEDANRCNCLVTGLIYIDEKKPSLMEDIYHLTDTPLNRLTEDRLRPPKETIAKVNQMLF